MSKTKVIKPGNLPTRFPITTTVLTFFLLHYFNAAEWLWTVFIMLYVIYYILLIVRLFITTQEDIFK